MTAVMRGIKTALVMSDLTLFGDIFYKTPLGFCRLSLADTEYLTTATSPTPLRETSMDITQMDYNGRPLSHPFSFF